MSEQLPYERFTDRARKVMALANQEAQLFNQLRIGTEHILLALIKEGSGVAVTVLKNRDVDILCTVLRRVRELVGRQPELVSIGKLLYTPSAERVFEFASKEAQNMGCNYIDTEHILLGLLREGEGIAAQILTALGFELEAVRAEVLALVAQHEGGAGELDSPEIAAQVVRVERPILPQPWPQTQVDEGVRVQTRRCSVLKGTFSAVVETLQRQVNPGSADKLVRVIIEEE